MLLPILPCAGALLSAVRGVAASPVEQSASVGTNVLSSQSITISDAQLTSKWFEGSDRVQIVELNVTNNHPDIALVRAHHFKVKASGSLVKLINEGAVHRLLPGHSTIVQLGIKRDALVNRRGIKERAAPCDVTLTATWGSSESTSQQVSGTCGIDTYTADANSLAAHSVPQWYQDAKFGIFIHWGLYSVPAYGGLTPDEVYAEWYWFNMANPNGKGGTYNHHKQTWGENFNYDDFMPMFTASKYDPKAWMDLIAGAGAKYIVPVTKHHEGFAIFNFSSSISERSSMHYGPKKDLLGELFDAAKTHYPDIHRGTYFSMPEWYNPKYKYSNPPSGFSGGPAKNPYTGATVPYTGYVEVNDFVADIQLPQMEQLAYAYDTEIMWCDIGGPSDASSFTSAWFNWAAGQNRQVTINNRCGNGVSGDFTTPEYTTNSKTVTRKWETNRGMDPFSFGYNSVTPDNKYLTGEDIVKSLVDTVSKNGNLLLDIGPKGDGSIPDIMANGLKDAGSWIVPHSESIFSTNYWSTTPGSDPFRYTTTSSAFYIHINTKPTSTSIRIPDQIPYVNGDAVTVVGGSLHGTAVSMKINSDNSRQLTITQAIINADKYVWTFKIAY